MLFTSLPIVDNGLGCGLTLAFAGSAVGLPRAAHPFATQRRMQDPMPTFADLPKEMEVAIVGAGLTGINMAHHVQTTTSKSFLLLEARDDIGGTWSQHTFPGIRSDSDMYSYGFSWYPWTSNRAVATGSEIMQHMRDALTASSLNPTVYLRSKLVHATWDSNACRWTLTIMYNHPGPVVARTSTLRAQYLFFSTGFFDFDQAHFPTIPGLNKFRGTLVHPQFWPNDLEYKDKKVVIVGSGSTAVTLLPELAKSAVHVTLVQRTPGYFIDIPRVAPEAKLLHWILPATWAFQSIKWVNILLSYLFIGLSLQFPRMMRWVLRKGVQSALPEHIPLDPHFDPPYMPWDQRMCITPDGEFFQALRSNKASILTGSIKGFTQDSIVLHGDKEGIQEERQADIVVMATGFNIKLCGGATLWVDGHDVDISQRFMYQGTILSNVPNVGVALGYVLATWTLGTDLCCKYMCRLIQEMDHKGADGFVVPLDQDAIGSSGSGQNNNQSNGSSSSAGTSTIMQRVPILRLHSGFVKRASHLFPSAGSVGSWRPRHFFPVDQWSALTRSLGKEIKPLIVAKDKQQEAIAPTPSPTTTTTTTTNQGTIGSVEDDKAVASSVPSNDKADSDDKIPTEDQYDTLPAMEEEGDSTLTTNDEAVLRLTSVEEVWATKQSYCE